MPAREITLLPRMSGCGQVWTFVDFSTYARQTDSQPEPMRYPPALNRLNPEFFLVMIDSHQCPVLIDSNATLRVSNHFARTACNSSRETDF
jgi:hypothetical protein